MENSVFQNTFRTLIVQDTRVKSTARLCKKKCPCRTKDEQMFRISIFANCIAIPVAIFRTIRMIIKFQNGKQRFPGHLQDTHGSGQACQIDRSPI